MQFMEKHKSIDFEELGFQTTLESGDEERAKTICALHLHAYADKLQPELSNLGSAIQQEKTHALALHSHLYDRAIPVSDAAMLSHSLASRILLVLAALAALACLAGNTTTFYLFGFGSLVTMLLAAGTTALPLVVGHLAYERILVRHSGVQAIVILTAVALGFGGLVQLAVARRNMVDKAVTAPAASSYVDGMVADNPTDQAATNDDHTESHIRRSFGDAMLLIMLAADMVLGLLVGLVVQMWTNEDYAAWQELQKVSEIVTGLERRVSELVSSVEIAKKRCMAGILRAQNMWKKRRFPYHQLLSVLAVLVLFAAPRSYGQAIKRYEGILVDTSGSIGKGGPHSDLFREYLFSAKKLLLTEPPNTRVWVTMISTDSFGGVREIVKGWTPDARGVFTDDLNHARHQLATAFEAKSSGMSPVAAGTDIFGALWTLKTRFESLQKGEPSDTMPKTIWIFSDMMNETANFLMPALISTGPQQMLERTKASGLLIPLNGYKVYVYGASTSGLTPEVWGTLKKFWMMYFKAAGAELVAYSAECDLER